MRYIQEAQNIDGWMTPRELSYLRQIALSMPRGARVFEVGSWKGRSTVALAVDHINLTCVDTFEGSRGDINRELAAVQDIEQIFHGNMARLGLNPTVWKLKSLEAASLIPDGILAGVFEDADHGKAFRIHFYTWLRKVKRGGLYFGHDYCQQFPHIMATLNNSQLKFAVLPHTSIWILRKP